ncbi:MAG: cellulase family glycosylhydrolase [Candidatus Daviesbacteria bacterium]|nr:cellulase family glycosylhydrolase [Candidatus Daviesbacteria bacterium]
MISYTYIYSYLFIVLVYEIENSGYLSPYGSYPISYKDYVGIVVQRYKDNPNILMWQLMNEAESKDTAGTEDPTSLYNFTKDISAYIKSLDPNHLVSLGTMGGGQPGQRNGNYVKLHSLNTIDLLEAHDFNKATEVLPGSPLRSKISVKLYAQDKNSTWITLGNTYKTIVGDWTFLTSSVPSTAVLPLKKIGLHLKNDSSYIGSINIDAISIGSNFYSFENGTNEGWQYEGSVFSGLQNSNTLAYDGTKSLSAALSGVITSGKIFTTDTQNYVWGTPITISVYTPADVPLSSTNSLAADLRIAQDLNKPLFVGEAGIKINCTSSNCYSADQRAKYFEDKMNAFFQNKGAGYIIWSYRDSKGEIKDYQFDLNDPLISVISNIYNSYIKP